MCVQSVESCTCVCARCDYNNQQTIDKFRKHKIYMSKIFNVKLSEHDVKNRIAFEKWQN